MAIDGHDLPPKKIITAQATSKDRDLDLTTPKSGLKPAPDQNAPPNGANQPTQLDLIWKPTAPTAPGDGDGDGNKEKRE